MSEDIGPLTRLVRGMADRIDQDRRSPTRHEAIGNTARVAAARAAAEGTVGGRLWTMTALPCWRPGTPSTPDVEAGGPGRQPQRHRGANHGAGR